jgi:hypothetical protein
MRTRHKGQQRDVNAGGHRKTKRAKWRGGDWNGAVGRGLVRITVEDFRGLQRMEAEVELMRPGRRKQAALRRLVERIQRHNAYILRRIAKRLGTDPWFGHEVTDIKVSFDGRAKR